MRGIKTGLLAVSILALSASAVYAACPPGQVPGGGVGVFACVPANRPQGLQQQQVRQPQQQPQIPQWQQQQAAQRQQQIQQQARQPQQQPQIPQWQQQQAAQRQQQIQQQARQPQQQPQIPQWQQQQAAQRQQQIQQQKAPSDFLQPSFKNTVNAGKYLGDVANAGGANLKSGLIKGADAIDAPVKAMGDAFGAKVVGPADVKYGITPAGAAAKASHDDAVRGLYKLVKEGKIKPNQNDKRWSGYTPETQRDVLNLLGSRK